MTAALVGTPSTSGSEVLATNKTVSDKTVSDTKLYAVQIGHLCAGSALYSMSAFPAFTQVIRLMQAVSPDGALFVTGSKKGALHSYQIAAPQQQQPVPSSSNKKTEVHLCACSRKSYVCLPRWCMPFASFPCHMFFGACCDREL